MKKDDYFKLLEKLAVLNYDNGKQFTRKDRLIQIENILKDTEYKKLNSDGLFELYAKGDNLPEKIVLVSSHIDCKDTITKCFVEKYSDEFLLGTFDNLVTNAIIVSLMIENKLNENIVIAFTGDEEEESTGAYDVIDFLENSGKKVFSVVLDVTDMGWDEKASFTIENNFWDEFSGESVIDIASKSLLNWCFVPSDVDDIPYYVPEKNVIYQEAEPDESWDYDEMDIECFSFCIPTKGEMHSDNGIFLREKSLGEYACILEQILHEISIIS